MSMYNMLFGMNQLTPILKAILELDSRDFPKPWPKELIWHSEEENKDYLDIGGQAFGWESTEEGRDIWENEYYEKCIKEKIYPSGRFRDICLDDNKIVLYTRNGGGNREYYQYVFDLLRKHPNYIRDYDDAFDSTYAYIEFSIPNKFKEALSKIKTDKPMSISDKFHNIFTEIKNMKKEDIEKDKRFKPILKILKKIGG